MSDRETPIEIAQRLAADVSQLRFSAPVSMVYNPLEYAWQIHKQYLELYGNANKRTLFLGMNPGPWGMAQTGVPFGEVSFVREWLGLTAPVQRPEREHPARPVEGLECPRSEVSGRRLWSLFAERSGEPGAFFGDALVLNYCPLLFLEDSGRNRTPNKLPAAERAALFEPCDRALLRFMNCYRPQFVVGIGAFVTERLHKVVQSACGERGGSAAGPSTGESHRLTVETPEIVQILHPSPASPKANRDWAGVVTRTLTDAGVWNG